MTKRRQTAYHCLDLWSYIPSEIYPYQTQQPIYTNNTTAPSRLVANELQLNGLLFVCSIYEQE